VADPADDADAEVLAEAGADDVTVPAAAAPAPRPVTRQQRVTGNAQRRPGAKKKRR
jgi:hypothetical protein